jgi:hypothetical protein
MARPSLDEEIAATPSVTCHSWNKSLSVPVPRASIFRSAGLGAPDVSEVAEENPYSQSCVLGHPGGDTRSPFLRVLSLSC